MVATSCLKYYRLDSDLGPLFALAATIGANLSLALAGLQHFDDFGF